MRIHKLIKNTALLAMAFPLALFTSCSDGHEDDITDSDGGTEVTNDYTATTNVKNAVITDEIEGRSVNKSITIYEDFNHRYILHLDEGDIEFVHYTRKDGSWYNNCNYHGKLIDDVTDPAAKNAVTAFKDTWKTNQFADVACGNVADMVDFSVSGEKETILDISEYM